MKIIIAGGGIGGLVTALVCLHYGHDVTVLEQADSFAEVGAGIQLPPNAMKVFQALGIDGDITRNAFEPEALEARMGQSGLRLFQVPLGERALIAWHAPYLHIHRADYLRTLRNALQARAPKALRLGASVTSYEQVETSVEVTLADGERVHGEVLIGADGIHSTVRAQMLGPDAPIFTGNVAWRAVVPMERLGELAPNPTACVWMGRGRHGVTYRLRQGKLANFVGVVEREDWTKEGWHEQGTREEALADFEGWHPVVTNIIEQAETLHRWALFDRPPLETWVNGRVVLLGDAAHPMLPFMAQGAAMAVEDAWVIGAELKKTDGDVAGGLRAYQEKRYARASAVQAMSRANAKVFHKRGFVERLSTYGPMWLGGHIAPGLVRKRLNSIYGYDVTGVTF